MYNYNDDYVILFDEDGQPYIAHASVREMAGKAGAAIRNVASRAGSALKGMQRPGHKYYARLDDPKRPGKYLYFYSKEELDRYNAARTGAAQSQRTIKDLEKAYKANPTKENAARLMRARSGASADQQRYKDAESSARNNYNNSLRGRIDNATDRLEETANRLKGNASNAVSNAKSNFERMRDDLKKRAGVGARASYEKEQKESDEANARYDRILQGFRDAHARGDKESEERLGRTLRLYDQTREREEREAREAKNAYDSSWAGKANNMINNARNAINGTKDKATAALKDVRDKAGNYKNMSVDQIKKMNESLKSALGNTSEYIKSGREAIQNTTGVGLRDTTNTLMQKLSDADQTRDKVLQAHSAAVEAGDTEKAAELQRSFKLIDDYVSDLRKATEKTKSNYTSSIAGKVNSISYDAAEKLMQKFNEGKTLTKQEMSQLFAFFGNFMGGNK